MYIPYEVNLSFFFVNANWPDLDFSGYIFIVGFSPYLHGAWFHFCLNVRRLAVKRGKYGLGVSGNIIFRAKWCLMNFYVYIINTCALSQKINILFLVALLERVYIQRMLLYSKLLQPHRRAGFSGTVRTIQSWRKSQGQLVNRLNGTWAGVSGFEDGSQDRL